MEDEVIFDLSETDDLPTSCKKQLKLINVRDDAQRILDLFKLKSELSINEIIVGLYRQYDLEKSRSWVSSTLYNLKRKNLIQKINNEKGLYARVY